MSEYGEVIAARIPVTVMRADPVALCTVRFLRDVAEVHFNGPDILFFGKDRDGREVRYRITGWDAEERALIMHRIEP